MRTSTVIAVAAVAAATPSFVGALPTPQSGSAASVSLSDVDKGVGFVTDVANAVPAIKQAWNSITSRDVEELLAREPKHRAHTGKHSKGHSKAHARELEELLAREPKSHGHHGTKHTKGHKARQDSSDAISWSTIKNIGGIASDGWNAFEAGKNAVESLTNSNNQQSSKRELDDLMELMAREPKSHHRTHGASKHSKAHAARQDGSEAFSLGSLGKIFGYIKDGADAANAGANVYQAVTNNNRRELDDLVELMARQDGSQAFSLGSLGKIIGYVKDGAEAADAGANVYQAVTNNNNRRELDDLVELMARQDGSQAFSLGSLGKITGYVKDGAEAANAGANVYQAVTNNNNRREFDDLLELMARQDDGSQAFSWSSLGKIFNIFSDGASAVSAGANAVNTVQNQQSKREFDDLVRMMARQDGSDAISWSTIKNIGGIAADGWNAFEAGKNAVESFTNSGNNQQQSSKREFDDIAELMARQAASDASVSLNDIDTGVHIVTDAANAVPAIKQAWDSITSRSLLDELD